MRRGDATWVFRDPIVAAPLKLDVPRRSIGLDFLRLPRPHRRGPIEALHALLVDQMAASSSATPSSRPH